MGTKLELGNNDTQLTIDFTEYLDALYSHAAVLSRNRTETEDLVQENRLRAMGRLRGIRSKQGPGRKLKVLFAIAN